MTAAAPASSSFLHTTGSSVVYGRTTKSSRTSVRVASSSASLSGKSVRSSPITSSFTQFDRPASRPSRAVPTMRREENVFPAMVKPSMAVLPLPAAHEIHDFHLIALPHDGLAEGGALQHDGVVLDRDAARIDVEARKQLGYGQRSAQLEAF